LFEEQEIDHETLTQMEEHHFVDIDLPTGKHFLPLTICNLLLPRLFKKCIC
jgi:hypothetical protein